jgi:hypothetical protein
LARSLSEAVGVALRDAWESMALRGKSGGNEVRIIANAPALPGPGDETRITLAPI